MQLVPGFQALPTQHCQSGSLLNIYHYHGCQISEDMILGLAGVLGFHYLYRRGKVPFLIGREGGDGRNAFQEKVGMRTGVQITSFVTAQPAKAKDVLLNSLADGEPVMIHTDMAYLPYFRLPDGQHLGSHVVVAAGHDPDSGEVAIADRDGLHILTAEQVALARGSTFPVFPARNRWYRADFANQRAPRRREIVEAMREVTERMLRPLDENRGLAGIRKAARAVRRWPRTMGRRQLRYAFINVYLYIDAAGGTGGGSFRQMYRRFVDETAVILCEPRLTEAAELVQIISDQWRQVGLMFKEAADLENPAEALGEISNAIAEVVGHEERAWSFLDETLRTL